MALYNLYKHQYNAARLRAGLPIKKKKRTIVMNVDNNLSNNIFESLAEIS